MPWRALRDELTFRVTIRASRIAPVARDYVLRNDKSVADFDAAGVLAFGDQKEQPGADLNAAWYLRNAKIFAS